MIQENIWREKIGTVLVTIALTALGSVAVQSAKYIFVDYNDAVKGTEERFEAKITPKRMAHERWKHFAETRDPIMERSLKRLDIISGSEPLEPLNKIDERKLTDALRSAYSDLGTISYTAVSGAGMEAERATLVENLKSEIGGLELVNDWKNSSGAHGPKDRLKLAMSLQRFMLQDEQTANAALEAAKGAALEAAEESKDMEAALKRFNRELDEERHWAHFATYALCGSLVAYVLLLGYLMAPKHKLEEKQAVSAAAAQ